MDVMELSKGTRLGPYAIEKRIGVGGMGVVYRAEDSRLGRAVAIKVLPPGLGGDEEQLRRFEREARTIGSLNHPNLLTLHDVGDHEGTRFLVMELLEGESLRARLVRGPLRLREALQIAIDVAHGLAAAHDAGVIHRDIKPENIYLTNDGRTKILDFGIAKLRRPRTLDDDIGNNATAVGTDVGMIIGTPGYMAPEQLVPGNTIDARADIFSIGVVLYELIAGRRPFAAATMIEESYAILKTPIEPPAGAPPAVARILLRCLDKRPELRFQSAQDFAFALEEIDASTAPVPRISASELEITAPRVAFPPPTTARSRWPRVLGIAGLVVAIGAGGVLIGRQTMTTPAPAPAPAPAAVAASVWPSLIEGGPVYRRVTYHSQTQGIARLAADRASVLYSMRRNDRTEVVRSETQNPSIQPTGVVGQIVDVSRRGELAVVTDALDPESGGTLVRVLPGGGPRALADRVTAASWLPDGDAIAIIRRNDRDLALEYPIGTVIAKRAAGTLDNLRAAPDGERFAFADHPAARDTAGRVIVVDRRGTELVASTELAQIEGIAWSPDGSEVWFSSGATIFALDRLGHQRTVLRGPGRLVLLDVVGQTILVAPADLRLKMFTGVPNGPARSVGWFDSSDVGSVSADGASISFSEAGGTGLTPEGYATYLRRGAAAPSLLGHFYSSALLPDASAVIAVSGAAGPLRRIPTGAGVAVEIPHAPIATFDISDRMTMSWGGRYVVLRGATSAGGAMRLWRIDLGHPVPEPIGPDDVPVGLHPISPDGAWVAVANRGGGITLLSATKHERRQFQGPPDDRPLGFTRDGAALFVSHLRGDAIEVERLDLAAGTRAAWTTITPEQHPIYYSIALDADGGIVTYSVNSDSSDLYILEQPSDAGH